MIVAVILIPFALVHSALASNILFFHLIATSSHRTSIWPLAEKLADKGHHVTYIFPMENPPGHHPKIEELTPSKMVPLLRDYVGNFDINFRLNNTVDQWTGKLFSTCLQLCEAFYDSPEVKEWLAKPKLHYDLVMIDALPGDCAYGLVHRFKARHVLFTPVIPHFIWDAMGIVPVSSSIPEGYFHRRPNEMTLVNRILGTFSFISWRFEFLSFLTHVERVIRDKLNLNGKDDVMPSLEEFERNTSLVLVNSHFIDDYAMALPPVIQVYSGLWCSKDKLSERKPLPKDLLDFLEAGDSDGFIYVSFGSSVVASAMPASERNKFFQAFRSFPRLKFLWKWTGTVPGDTPGNVLLQPWYPQRDVMAHPKIKGFITQAGRPSLQEALCHAVPMITFPIFADQDYNANRLEYLGTSVNLDIGNITTANLQTALKDIAYSETYRNRLKELSKMFRDRPLDPLDNAVYWTEYVLRHRDVSLLKPLGMKQTWYQRRLLDVYAVIGVVILLVAVLSMLTFYAIVKCLYNSSFGTNSNKKPRLKLKKPKNQ